jgi:hypothetical protein
MMPSPNSCENENFSRGVFAYQWVNRCLASHAEKTPSTMIRPHEDPRLQVLRAYYAHCVDLVQQLQRRDRLTAQKIEPGAASLPLEINELICLFKVNTEVVCIVFVVMADLQACAHRNRPPQNESRSKASICRYSETQQFGSEKHVVDVRNHRRQCFVWFDVPGITREGPKE